MAKFLSAAVALMRRCVAAGVVFVFATPFLSSCNSCPYDESDLPVVRCDVVPSGSPGCHGLPDGKGTRPTRRAARCSQLRMGSAATEFTARRLRVG